MSAVDCTPAQKNTRTKKIFTGEIYNNRTRKHKYFPEKEILPYSIVLARKKNEVLPRKNN